MNSPPKHPPAVELAPDGRSVRIGPYAVERRGRRGRLARSPRELAHMLLDQLTFELLLFLVLAVRRQAPCLLEGPTAASKTSVIQLLASLTNHTLYRVNLHGQTSADDLLGRFVPCVGLGFSPDGLLRHRNLLHPDTVALLEKARRENRDLDEIESGIVAARERLPVRQWRFQEACLPRAMREGAWLVIDEMNLAPPEAVESVNAVLESPPSLHLPGPDLHFGPGGTVRVHEGFRVFATINPAAYEGRRTLSPAFRNRWRMPKSAPAPGEAEFRQMLRWLVFGEVPVVECQGQQYQGIMPPLTRLPPFAALARVAGMEELLERVAILHGSLVKAQVSAGLRAGGSERLVFTRRDLFTFLGQLQDELNQAPGADLKRHASHALQLVYLDRLGDPEDRKVVTHLMESQCLDAAHWPPGAQTTRTEPDAAAVRLFDGSWTSMQGAAPARPPGEAPGVIEVPRSPEEWDRPAAAGTRRRPRPPSPPEEPSRWAA